MSQGVLIADFQLKQVTLDPNISSAVSKKVQAQQIFQQQLFDEATAQKQADIKRISRARHGRLGGDHRLRRQELHGDPERPHRAGDHPEPVRSVHRRRLSPAFLQFTYIQALQALATSQGTNTLVLPFDKNLTPLIQVPSGSSSAATP